MALPVAATLLLAAPAQAAPGRTAGHLLMVSVPGLTWSDLDGGGDGLDTLRGLVAASAVANLSTRTVTSVTDPADGYATVGAGARTTAGDADGALAVDADEPVEGGTGAGAFAARTGHRSTGAVLQLATGPIRQANDAELYGARPGLLGSTLRAGHRRTAVVANADVAGSWHREAALAVMDTDGAVDAGTVSPDLLAGANLDPAAVERAVDAAWPAADLLLVEASDLARLDFATNPAATAEPADSGDPNEPGDAGPPASDQAQRQRAAALRSTDAMLAGLLSRVDPDRDTVLLFSPAPATGDPGMGVFALRGPGVRPGLAVSASTRRNGYVTLPDLAPTVLRDFGLTAPAAMSGTPVTTGDDPRPATAATAGDPRRTAATAATATARQLAADNDRAVFRDRVYGPVTVLFLIMIAALCALAVAALRLPRLRLPAAALSLAVLALPPLTFLSGLVRYAALGVVGYPLSLLAASALIALTGTLLSHRRPRPTGPDAVTPAAGPEAALPAAGAEVTMSAAGPEVSPPSGGSGVTLPGGRWGLVGLGLVAAGWLVQVVDVVTGANLQLDTVFGYSPVVAGRFAGLGNQAFALLAATAVLLVAGGWAVLSQRYGQPRDDSGDDSRDGDGAGRVRVLAGRVLVGRRRWAALGAAALVLVVTVVVDGGGAFGADVGGVLAVVPGFAVLLALLAGLRLGWRRVAAIAGLTVLVIGGFAVLDLLRPASSRTHLGRFVAGIGSGDTLVIERKVAANLNVLTSSAWTWLVPLVAAFLVVWALPRVGALRRLRDRVPGLGAALVGLAVVGALGFALNDSGIAVPTMMAAVLVPYLVLLAAGDRWDPDHRATGAELG